MPRYTFALTILAALATTATASPYKGYSRKVSSGQSIQSAIDAARPGEFIYVEAGTYAEQVVINQNGISLVSPGAIIVPPATFKENICSGLAGNGTEAGICIAGTDVILAPFVFDHLKFISVGKRVKDVSVSGFEIRGFGLNVAIVGARNTVIKQNKLVEGLAYGLLAVGSYNTKAIGNVVTANSLNYIAMCMDDKGDSSFIKNSISGYTIGLCIQTPSALIKHNTVKNCCAGAFADPGITNARIIGNHISSLNPACPPTAAKAGIIVFGAINTLVKGNYIEGMKSNNTAAGIVVADDMLTPLMSPAQGNVITRNYLENNDLDFFLNTTQTTNVIKDNKCSTPQELCAL